jgi:hypothetical protein
MKVPCFRAQKFAKQQRRYTITMKINLLALVTIIGCNTSAVRASTCVESSGVCVCSGECPSFTADWPARNNPSINGNKICAVNNIGINMAVGGNGDVTVDDGQTYPYTTMDRCSGAMAMAGGMVGASARALVAAAAVAGVVYAL